MNAKTPPVPPENRSPKGPGDPSRPDTDTRRDEFADEAEQKRGRSENIAQNTNNQGYQQDR